MNRKLNRKIRVISLAICIGLLSVFASACNKENKNGDTNTAAGAKEPLKISMMLRIDANIDFSNNIVFKEIEKKANVKLEIEAPPFKSYASRLTVAFASGEMPDVVYTNQWSTEVASFAKDGSIIALDDYIKQTDKYPNLAANISQNDYNFFMSNDTWKIYGIPKSSPKNLLALYIRKDWLDKLGLKVPETAEEFMQVATAFATQDPDGNGKDDTYGFTFDVGTKNNVYGSNANIMSAFSLNNEELLPDADGQYRMLEKRIGYMGYLNFLREMYSKGALDKEFILNGANAREEKFEQGRVGIISHTEVYLSSKLNNDLNKYAVALPLKNSNGERLHFADEKPWGGFMITKNAKDIEGIMKFFDWLNSEEGIYTAEFGIQGKTYESYDMETRKLIVKPEQVELRNSVMNKYTYFTARYKGEPVIYEGVDSEEEFKWVEDFTKNYNEIVKIQSIPITKSTAGKHFWDNNTDLIDEKKNQEVKYVMGVTTEQQFRDFLEKKWYPAAEEREKEIQDMMKNGVEKYRPKAQ